ncbi:hypothetical protein [Polaromonas sp.]|uniref:hypothetical protein n=1 Tax=Polaromonas sp. TaxID=1869339 RepID=UPI003CC48FFB
MNIAKMEGKAMRIGVLAALWTEGKREREGPDLGLQRWRLSIIGFTLGSGQAFPLPEEG